jgi:uncharacterized protein (DUF1015 family)
VARVSPFAAWLFDPDKIGDIGQAVSPPYDRVDQELQADIRRRGQVNILQIMPARHELSDDNIAELADAAGQTAARWRNEGIVRRDAEPGFYYYRQGYVDHDGRPRVRKGFFALLDLEPENSRVVLPQETDWVNPRIERLQILEATRTAAAPISLFFSDAEREVMSLLAGAAAEVDPCVDADCPDGSSHAIIPVTDPDVLRKVAALMNERTVILADGHHRYRTAHAFAEAHPDLPAARKIMACFMPIEDDGLALRPIHRAVTGLPSLSPNDLLFELSKTFYIRELEQTDPPTDEVTRALAALAEDDAEDEATYAAVIAGVPEMLLLTVKNDAAKLVLPEGLAEPIRDMDVSLLHRLILEGPLKLDPADRSNGSLIFFHDAYRLPKLIADGTAQAVFLLNPMASRQLYAVLNAGLKLPHKAARFSPDIPAGLVMRRLDENDSNGGHDE